MLYWTAMFHLYRGLFKICYEGREFVEAFGKADEIADSKMDEICYDEDGLPFDSSGKEIDFWTTLFLSE